MKVFISWSGQASFKVADALRDWLPCVIQELETWLSTEDIRKGARWQAEIGAALNQSRAGIICLTPTNTSADWLLYEAGALSKAVPNSSTAVCTYLHELEPADLGRSPLAQFQHTRADKQDTLRLLKALNYAREVPMEEGRLTKLHDKWWPDLAAKLKAVAPDGEAPKPARSERELLEDIWELLNERSRSSFLELENASNEIEAESGPPKVVDLMEALRRSLDQVSSGKKSSGRSGPGRRPGRRPRAGS